MGVLHKAQQSNAAIRQVSWTNIAFSFPLLFFPEQLEEFIKDWDENGPGSCGPELERGVRLMDPYSQKLNERELRRQELANAERLFDMPMVDYHEFSRVQTEFEGLQIVSTSFISWYPPMDFNASSFVDLQAVQGPKERSRNLGQDSVGRFGSKFSDRGCRKLSEGIP